MQTLIIGVDPAWSGSQGITMLLDGKLKGFKTVTTTEYLTKKYLLRDAHEHAAGKGSGTRVVVVIEEWTVFMASKGTNANTYVKLERGGEQWSCAAEENGFSWMRVNSSTWQSHFGIKRKTKNQRVDTKTQAQGVVLRIFDRKVTKAVADSFLIAQWKHDIDNNVVRLK